MKRIVVILVLMFMFIPNVFAQKYDIYNIYVDFDDNVDITNIEDVNVSFLDSELKIFNVKVKKEYEFAERLNDTVEYSNIGFEELYIDNASLYSYKYELVDYETIGTLTVTIGLVGKYQYTPLERNNTDTKVDEDGSVIIGTTTGSSTQTVDVNDYGTDYIYDDDIYSDDENILTTQIINDNANNDPDDYSNQTVGVQMDDKIGLTIMKYVYIVLGIVAIGFVIFGIVKVMKANQ